MKKNMENHTETLQKNELTSGENQPHSNSPQKDTQQEEELIAKQKSAELFRKKMIFCALMETAIDLRSEYFNEDLERLGEYLSRPLAKIADKKLMARKVIELKNYLINLKGDKQIFDQRTAILVGKTLKQIPMSEDKKEYDELLDSLKEYVK